MNDSEGRNAFVGRLFIDETSGVSRGLDVLKGTQLRGFIRLLTVLKQCHVDRGLVKDDA